MAFNNTSTDILIAGAFAAFSVDFLVFPLDTIKTRIQSEDYKRLYTKGHGQGINRALFRGLYQGIGSVILATVPSSGAFFTTYEGTKKTLIASPVNPYLPTPVLHGIASCAGELVSCLILTPAEVLKQNAQMVQKSSSSGTGLAKTSVFDTNATIQTMKKFKSNPGHLWRGYAALAGRNLPFTGMQFPMFEYIRSRVLSYRESKGIRSQSLLETGTVTGISAGSAGAVAAVITTPIDVIKTRVMLSAGEESSIKPRERVPKKGGIEVGREIWKNDGMKGIFRGATLRGVWTALGAGLYLGVYESGRKYLEGRRLDSYNG